MECEKIPQVTKKLKIKLKIKDNYFFTREKVPMKKNLVPGKKSQ
jgi:hypothetical protein